MQRMIPYTVTLAAFLQNCYIPIARTLFENLSEEKKRLKTKNGFHQKRSKKYIIHAHGKVTTSPGTQDPTKERFKSQSTVRGMRRCVPVASSEKSSCNLMRCQSMPRHLSRFTVKRAKRPETDGLKIAKCQYANTYINIHVSCYIQTPDNIRTKIGNSYLVSKNCIPKKQRPGQALS